MANSIIQLVTLYLHTHQSKYYSTTDNLVLTLDTRTHTIYIQNLHTNLLRAACVVDHQGRIIVTDYSNDRLVAFSSEGDFLGSFGQRGTEPGQFAYPFGIAVDARGRVIVSDYGNHRVQIIGAGRWFYDRWTVENHRSAPKAMQDAICMVTMIRSLEHSSVVSLLPNELLFEIFQMIELSAYPQTQRLLVTPPATTPAATATSVSATSTSTNSTTSTSTPASSRSSYDIEIGSLSDRTIKSTKRKCIVM